MNQIPIFVPRTSPRLVYILDWLFKERIGTGFRMLTSEEEAAALPFCISYGRILPQSLSIPDTGLLWESGIRSQQLAMGSWQDMPVICSTSETGYTLPFDLFSALFFHLSRYEEYLPFERDKHGRYPATASILYKTGLERPLADEWIHAFRMLLHGFGQSVLQPAYTFQPTYDIDIAWSYRYKGWKRSVGAGLSDLLSGRLQSVSDRLAVGSGKKKDPYDAFDTLQAWHRSYDFRPYYFVLAALGTSAFDKNISPRHPAMRALIAKLSSDGVIGLHPSYYCDEEPGRLSEEKKQLENILQREIVYSRQHYIKMKLPDTCRRLLDAGITDDFSMGYGTHLGFRAGTGQPFLWYDFTTEHVTALRLHPFCFMDTTARFEAGLSASVAFQRLDHMGALLGQTHSRLTTIFHNFSLGTDPGWAGWAGAYHDFLQQQAG